MVEHLACESLCHIDESFQIHKESTVNDETYDEVETSRPKEERLLPS